MSFTTMWLQLNDVLGFYYHVAAAEWCSGKIGTRGFWAKSRNSGGGFPTNFLTLKVQRHQSKASEQVSKHAYVSAFKRCDWFFVEVILFNNISRVNVVEQIPTAFCSTTFSNNIYTCDPRNVRILYQNHSSLYQHMFWNYCWVKHTNLKHLHVETL